MKTRIGLAAVLALVALCTPSRATGQPSEWPIRVVTVAGEAEVYRKSAAAWSAATLRADLLPGDAARTTGGRLTLRAVSGQALRLAPASRVSLLEAGAPDQSTRVSVDGGAVWVAVMPGSPPRQQIEAQAGPVTVTVRGGGTWITLNPDGSVLVRVYHGAAECAGPGTTRQWNRTLAGEQGLSVSSAGVPGELRELKRDKLDAAWVKLNEEQDLAGGYGGKPPAR
jgi:hypothetical protein